MPPQNPFDQSVDNNQLGHDTDMNALGDSICINASMCVVD
jgi:hypothetical protein